MLNVIAVGKTWTAHDSCHLIIPKEIAKEERLDNTKVQFAKTGEGLLIRRLG
jgi:hypothetical protein